MDVFEGSDGDDGGGGAHCSSACPSLPTVSTVRVYVDNSAPRNLNRRHLERYTCNRVSQRATDTGVTVVEEGYNVRRKLGDISLNDRFACMQQASKRETNVADECGKPQEIGFRIVW